MSFKPKIIAICSTLILMMSAPALAGFQMSGEDQRPRWESMPDGERDAMRSERKARWDSMSEEERSAKRNERKARWDSMSEGERSTMRERRGSDGSRRMH